MSEILKFGIGCALLGAVFGSLLTLATLPSLRDCMNEHDVANCEWVPVPVSPTPK